MMKVNVCLSDAYANLKGQGVKPLIAILGLLVGVATFYILINLKLAALKQTEALMLSLGPNRFVAHILPTHQSSRFQTIPLTPSTIANLESSLSGYRLVPYQLIAESVYFKQLPINAQVVAVDENFFDLLSLNIARGRGLTGLDNGLNTVIIGDAIYQKIITKHVNPIHSNLQIGYKGFMIEGVLAHTALNPLYEFDINQCVFIPLSQLQSLANHNSIETILVAYKDKNFQAASREFKLTLQHQYHQSQVFLKHPQMFVEAIQQQADQLFKVFSWISVLTLILGIVGLLNTQWISLIERKAEVGMRISIGATPIDIAKLFFMETLLLVSLGATIGLILGVAGYYWVVKVISWSYNMYYLSLGWVFILVLILLSFGSILPLYSAFRSQAAKLLAAKQ